MAVTATFRFDPRMSLDLKATAAWLRKGGLPVLTRLAEAMEAAESPADVAVPVSLSARDAHLAFETVDGLERDASAARHLPCLSEEARRLIPEAIQAAGGLIAVRRAWMDSTGLDLSRVGRSATGKPVLGSAYRDW